MPVRKKLAEHRRSEPRDNFAEFIEAHANIIDEKITTVLQAMWEEARRIEDKNIRERWMDSLQTFARTGDIEVLLRATEYRRRVVDMETFMYDPLYLGIERGSIYPVNEQALFDIDEGDFNEVVLGGALGVGKTTIANIGIARDVYKLSCMRNPQTSFGIQGKATITLTVQSVRLSTAKIAIFQEIGEMMTNSPYFREIFPYNHKIQSRMLFPEHRIQIMPATSSTTGVISMNVIGGLLDEANFMQKIAKSKSQFSDDEGIFDQAKELYKTLAGRRKTRFNKRGRLPGTFYIASSARYPTDFTEERAAKSEMRGGKDPGIYVYSYAQWEAKPRSSFMREEFQVQIGNESHRSRVLAEGEVPNLGCSVISVPMDFYQEFLDDPDKSIRDFAGRTLLATNPFIARRETIRQSFELAQKYGYQQIYGVQDTDLSGGVPLPDVSKARIDVPSYRVAHIDLGLRKDAAGVAIGHIAGYKVGRRRMVGAHGEIAEDEQMTVLPVIAIDAVMRIKPPLNDEIDFSEVRRFLHVFRRETGLNLQYVTTDGFQSVDTRQILRKENFMTDYQSVESVESYRALRETLYDGRLLIPEHAYLDKELRELETHIVNNKEKVDHPNVSTGSKDVADAVCGVVQFLLSRRSTWANAHMDKGPGYHLYGNFDPLKPDMERTGPYPVGQRESGRKLTLRKPAQRRTLARAGASG